MGNKRGEVDETGRRKMMGKKRDKKRKIKGPKGKRGKVCGRRVCQV